MSNTLSHYMAMVAPVEAAFRSRWRLSTLARINPDLHKALLEQIDLYHTTSVTGSDAEFRIQAEAMVRGWRAACMALESPLRPDDAYLEGFDAHTGTRVVIADHTQSVGRVQAKDGERVVLVSPDEVAKMVAGMGMIAEIKSFFPDAELTQVHVR